MPPELKEQPNWVLWVPIWSGSKWTKCPFQISGYGASTTNPKHWSSFDGVREAYDRAVQEGSIAFHRKGKPAERVPIGGVGFVFDGQPDSEGLVLAGVDFDKVVSGGQIASLACERIKRLGSYCEPSVSGSGLHVIVKAKPLARGIAHGGVEMYTNGRFFTMTGAAPANAQIIAASDAFAALADELLTEKAGSSAGEDNSGGRTDQEDAAAADTSNWFRKLSLGQRSEVVEYAALHIAKYSKLFEQSKNGGNYQEYLRLAFAIARAGVEDAEDIFVKAASTAKDADPEHDLRKFFQNCNNSKPQTDGITVGTLFHAALNCGADFAKWKQLAAECDPKVAMFTPGNEEACRKLLAGVVAADQWTYTLGDVSGPLVILRVPGQAALPEETKWEGDLPGTTLAAPADVMERAERITWMKKGQSGPYRIRPPRDFVTDYLTQMRGRYGARPLRGIVRVPYIDDSGQIRFHQGYDPQTGLFHDKSPIFSDLANPTLHDAKRAANVLLYPFSRYRFEDPTVGQAMLLAAIITAIERPFLPVAPMFVVRSSMPGTGKGLIVRALVRLAFDTAPIFITWGGSSEEFEKRLAALLLQTPSVLSIDNANGMQIKGDLIESIINGGVRGYSPPRVQQDYQGAQSLIRLINRQQSHHHGRHGEAVFVDRHFATFRRSRTRPLPFQPLAHDRASPHGFSYERLYRNAGVPLGGHAATRIGCCRFIR
jgi:hypothetical protein